MGEKETKEKEKFEEIKAKLSEMTKVDKSGFVEKRFLLGGIKALKNLLSAGVSNNLEEKIKNLKEKLEKKKDNPKVEKKNMGGTMGGGMNPMGRSPDPTVQSVTGYNPNTPMMRKKGGAIKRRGGGIAKRGFGIAK